MTAAELNAKWNALTLVFDKYYNVITPVTTRTTISKALSDWQDFFYGGENHEAAKVATWEIIYNKAAETLAAVVKSTGVPVSAPVNLPGKPAEKLGVSYIKGQNAFAGFVMPDLRSPKWWWFALPMLPAVYLMFRRR